MGQTLSTGLITEPVTLPRIWSACQLKSSMPPELQNFNINLLVSDMNKLGANIPTGLGTAETCKVLHDFLPNAEKVCFVGSNSENVYKMAELFNKRFNTRIPIYKNGIDKNDGMRPVADVCEDLYLTQQRVYRALNKNTLDVKKKLYDSILQLKAQQADLDAAFAKYKTIIYQGNKMDTVHKDLKNDLAQQQSVVTAYAAQLNTLQNMYNAYSSGINAVIPPLSNVKQGLTRAANTSAKHSVVRGGGNDVGSGIDPNVMSYFGGAVNLGIAGQIVNDVYRTLGTTFEEYALKARALPVDGLRHWVNGKKQQALLATKTNPMATIYDEALILKCAEELLAMADNAKNAIIGEQFVEQVVSDTCTSYNSHPNPRFREHLCNTDTMCAWLNGSCGINDPVKGLSGPGATKMKYIRYENYTVAAFAAMREYFTNNMSNYRGLTGTPAPDIFANQVEQLFTDKMFTQIFGVQSKMYPSLAKMEDATSSDLHGIAALDDMSKFYSIMVGSFADYLNNKYYLGVKNFNQDTFLAEVLRAFHTKKANNGLPNKLTDLKFFNDEMDDYASSKECAVAFSSYDNMIRTRPYVLGVLAF